MKTTGENRYIFILVAGLAAVMLSTTVYAAQGDPIVFPAGGQSNEQMEKDKYACYSWAKGQTGFDPMQVATAAPPPPPPPAQGGAVKGALGGAAVGATVGAVSGGDKSDSAAIGAAAGALVGGARRAKGKQQQQAAVQGQAAAVDQKRSEYNRAWSACMEGKKYTLK